jgi:hypothetical protein
MTQIKSKKKVILSYKLQILKIVPALRSPNLLEMELLNSLIKSVKYQMSKMDSLKSST